VALHTDPITAEVVTLIGRIVTRYNTEFDNVAAHHALTRVQSRALLALEEPLSMRELATRLRSEPSNVTGIVDRLEARGLIERRPDPADRRIKKIVTTEEGRTMNKDFKASLDFAAHPLATLDQGQRRQLRDLLRLMYADAEDV
jgi:DNA-binding MarR family transcriptional regulator